MLLLFTLHVALHFAHVDREVTQSLVKRWKPQMVNGNLITRDESMQNYVKASIHLNDMTANVCGLVSSNMNVFVIAIEKDTCVIRSCLWQPDTSRVDTIRSLRKWVFDRGYECVSILDGTDNMHWNLSEYQA
jgi:uncharacterized protein (DUF2461 family)